MAARAPRAGAVSQQNASPCGRAAPAPGETREREPAPSGAAVLVRAGAGGCSPRPRSSAGPARSSGEGGGGADRGVRRTARRPRLSPGPLCLPPQPGPLRCRCAGRGGRGAAAAAGRGEGALGPSRSAGGSDEPGPRGGGEREAALLLATGIPLGAGETRASRSRAGQCSGEDSPVAPGRGEVVGSLQSERLRESGGGGGTDGRTDRLGKVLGLPCREGSPGASLSVAGEMGSVSSSPAWLAVRFAMAAGSLRNVLVCASLDLRTNLPGSLICVFRSGPRASSEMVEL